LKFSPILIRIDSGNPARRRLLAFGERLVRFVRSDSELLGALVDLRVASIQQLAIVLDRNAHGLQRRIRALLGTQLVEVLARAYTPRRGRPEHLLAATKSGRELLRESGVERWSDVKSHKEVRNIDHQLLITEFRVHLVQLQRFLPDFEVRYLSSHDVEAPGADATGKANDAGSNARKRTRSEAFMPDVVFALTHRQLGKSLLFFLEADRGTEPLNSGNAERPYLLAKIATYRDYLLTEKYKRWESVVGAQLKGFRLLIVLAGRARTSGLAALVRGEPQGEFVWLTDAERLTVHGCWGPVWFAGGRLDAPPLSILGSKMPTPCPTPGELE
jgi:hypothetical protein